MQPFAVCAAMSPRSLLLGNSIDYDGARIDFATFALPLGESFPRAPMGKLLEIRVVLPNGIGGKSRTTDVADLWYCANRVSACNAVQLGGLFLSAYEKTAGTSHGFAERLRPEITDYRGG
jgi:hypothetical protein